MLTHGQYTCIFCILPSVMILQVNSLDTSSSQDTDGSEVDVTLLSLLWPRPAKIQHKPYDTYIPTGILRVHITAGPDTGIFYVLSMKHLHVVGEFEKCSLDMCMRFFLHTTAWNISTESFQMNALHCMYIHKVFDLHQYTGINDGLVCR